MKKTRWLLKAAFWTFPVLLSAPGAFAQGITIGGPGDPGTGNIYPFGEPVGAYQQIYAASDFSGPIAINGLTFFNQNATSGTILPATYEIQLSTTAAAVNGLSNTFADNLGANNTTVFNGILSGSATPSFTIPTSVFNYQPSHGNLLLTIYQSNVTGNGLSVALDDRPGDANGLFSRVYSYEGTTTANGIGTSGYGLVTKFDLTPVPEPPGGALLAGALGGIMLRFRRAK